MNFPKKIPTLLALILIVILVGGIAVLQQTFRTPSEASESQKPDHIRITNISDATFTVTWLTQLPTTGNLEISTPGKTNQVYFDERDTTGKLGSYVTHSIVVRDAKPLTDYTLTFISNGKKIPDNGKPTTVHTAANLQPNTNGLEPAYGTVHTTTGLPLDGAIIYLTVEGGQELSTIAKPSGLWLIPLNQVRTADLTSYLPTVERMTENITVVYKDEQATAITDTLNDSPVPEMIIGKSYDFRRQQAKTSGAKSLALRPTAAALPTGNVLGVSSNHIFTVALTAPAQGAAIAAALPLISGTGIPNTYVGISIGINRIMNGSAKVGSNGLWNFTPPRPLSPGKQSVTITASDAKGKPVAITHAFTVLKSGSQVLGDATPSATLAPTNTIAPTENLTPSPTEVITPTEISTESGTSTLSGEPPPNTGNELPTLLLILLGVGLLVSGSMAALR